jgi:hypothetical protein
MPRDLRFRQQANRHKKLGHPEFISKSQKKKAGTCAGF